MIKNPNMNLTGDMVSQNQADSTLNHKLSRTDDSLNRSFRETINPATRVNLMMLIKELSYCYKRIDEADEDHIAHYQTRKVLLFRELSRFMRTIDFESIKRGGEHGNYLPPL